MLNSTVQSTPTCHIAMVMDSLGHSAAEIAAFFLAHHIQGVRNAVRFMNPLIRYLQAEYQAEYHEKVFMDVIKGDMLRVLFANGERQELSLTDAEVDFLEDFDRGRFPELEEHLP